MSFSAGELKNTLDNRNFRLYFHFLFAEVVISSADGEISRKYDVLIQQRVEKRERRTIVYPKEEPLLAGFFLAQNGPLGGFSHLKDNFSPPVP